ncbi:MAG: hypothetical protein WBD41_24150 [Rhodococcus sp. (in: high G+C Gram-positive bacteria)]|uniref:hypothetical protein n=1 Tax=Rhodococcus sp. EPR-157 TaxID=1813677 RepID=UPI001E48A0AF|nr:hypothetical protein [Rhodococcus sp. EPR-157]
MPQRSLLPELLVIVLVTVDPSTSKANDTSVGSAADAVAGIANITDVQAKAPSITRLIDRIAVLFVE